MKKIKQFIVTLTAAAFLAAPMQAYAADVDTVLPDISVPVAADNEAVAPAAAGLIASRTLSISAGVKTVYITATTKGTNTMAKIGFVDIEVQRSSNNSTWTTVEKTLPDKLAEDTVSYSLSKYSTSVTGGYYYRVVLTHYAKEQGWFFPSSQSVSATSNSVWVPKT